VTSPVAFRPSALAFWASCPAEGFRPSYDRPTRTSKSPGPDGVSTFRAHKIRPGRAPSIPRGQRCSHGRRFISAAACRLCQRPGPATQVFHPSSWAFPDEASPRVHSRSPVRPSPRPVAPPDGTGALRLLPQASHPRQAGPARARRGGDRSRTLIRSYLSGTASLQSSNSLICATSCRTEPRITCLLATFDAAKEPAKRLVQPAQRGLLTRKRPRRLIRTRRTDVGQLRVLIPVADAGVAVRPGVAPFLQCCVVELAVCFHAGRQRYVLARGRTQPKHIRPSHDTITASHGWSTSPRTVDSDLSTTKAATYGGDRTLADCGETDAPT